GMMGVVVFRRSPVGVDRANLAGRNPRVFERQPHATRRALAFRSGRSHMMRVAIGGISEDLRIDFRAALYRPIPFFQDQTPRTFRDDETITLSVERAASALGFVVAG